MQQRVRVDNRAQTRRRDAASARHGGGILVLQLVWSHVSGRGLECQLHLEAGHVSGGLVPQAVQRCAACAYPRVAAQASRLRPLPLPCCVQSSRRHQVSWRRMHWSASKKGRGTTGDKHVTRLAHDRRAGLCRRSQCFAKHRTGRTWRLRCGDGRRRVGGPLEGEAGLVLGAVPLLLPGGPVRLVRQHLKKWGRATVSIS